MTRKEIDEICDVYGIKNYTINDDGTVDVNGSVYLIDLGLTKLPLKFGKVTGDFYCFQNQLTSLKGCPREVGGDFHCDYIRIYKDFLFPFFSYSKLDFKAFKRSEKIKQLLND